MYEGLAIFLFGTTLSVLIFYFKQRRLLQQMQDIQDQCKFLDYQVQTMIKNHARLTTQLQQRQAANTSSLLSD